MGHDHDHGLGGIRHERPLWWALALTTGFLAVEIVGAWWTNSLALLSDAAHMATDALALGVALVAVRLSRRPPDAKRTFGYARLEAIGALFNGGLLFVVAGFILWESVGRFRHPPELATPGIFVIAAAGLVVNLLAMRLLKAGSEESLNMKGAYLEVWSDMLGSIAVMAAAALIWFTGWRIIDPILAVLIGLWVLPRTVSLVREAVHVLLEGVPKGIDLAAVRDAMQATPGVDSIHDLHVWSLSSQRSAMVAHVVADRDDVGLSALRVALVAMLDDRFDLNHVTLQMEASDCAAPGCEQARAGTREPPQAHVQGTTHHQHAGHTVHTHHDH